MSAPWQAWFAVAWAVIGPPLLIYAALQVRRGAVSRHMGIMLAALVIELAVLAAFGVIAEPSPRREALAVQPLFRIHLALAFGALAGMAWQVTSRLVPALRQAHGRTGPIVVALWCLALITGIYNFIFLYLSS